MYQYIWDEETGGPLLITELSKFSKEPRPVYYKELDILGFDKYWNYPKDDRAPLMWAEANNYIYRGRKVASTKGGALYTPPELILLEEPEPNGQPLKFVDIARMVEKNSSIMETLVQETIQKVYNTYKKYKNKVDIFHVSYSGGKDSEVLLDIIQRALPHDDFIVIFGDTGMEFPDTYDIIDKTKNKCKLEKISFNIAHSLFDPMDSWNLFGPPSSALRWCCSVHKTTPQLLLLRDIVGKNNLVEMAFVGVRGDESTRRSGYDYISKSTKQKGQYSCNPILNWSSVEVFLYTYINKLPINEAYIKGSSRVGCLFCPMATNKSDFINYELYPKQVQPFIDIIKKLNDREKNNTEGMQSYLQNKAWKARKNGRDLNILINDYVEKNKDGKFIIYFNDVNDSWHEWIKSIGILSEENDNYFTLNINATFFWKFKLEKKESKYCLCIDESLVKQSPTFFKRFKNIFKKSHSCISCNACVANCPFGNISFIDGKVHISDDCIHCGQCNEMDNGCLKFDSLWFPKESGKMAKKSIDSYGTHSPKLEWIKQFVFLKDNFNENHSLGSVELPMFKKFLRDAEILTISDKSTPFANLIFDKGLETINIWAIMYSNLAHSPEIGWFIKNVNFNSIYTQKELKNTLSLFTTSKTGPANIANSYKRMALLPLNKVGFCEVIGKNKDDGFTILRKSWSDPDPLVVLYSLYKFAEKCGDYYQFTLTTLLDDSIERDGVSPTRIFGLDRETMIPLLNGLSANYPDFINVSFTLGLDTITLREDKKSEDVLNLF